MKDKDKEESYKEKKDIFVKTRNNTWRNIGIKIERIVWLAEHNIKENNNYGQLMPLGPDENHSIHRFSIGPEGLLMFIFLVSSIFLY
jgi:hypothetical protein